MEPTRKAHRVNDDLTLKSKQGKIKHVPPPKIGNSTKRSTAEKIGGGKIDPVILPSATVGLVGLGLYFSGAAVLTPDAANRMIAEFKSKLSKR